jgi:nucleoside-diphosphate-sugar epimerase
LKNNYTDHFCNLGCGQKIDLLRITQTVFTLLGQQVPVRIQKKGWNNEYTCSTHRLRNNIGSFKFTPFKQALQELINFYQNSNRLAD